MEDIDDIDYNHGNNLFKGFKLEITMIYMCKVTHLY